MFKTFKNFNINLNALNERGTFSGGDQLSGQISFDVRRQTKITSITLELKGGACVRWSTVQDEKRRKRRHPETITAKQQFFKMNAVIVRENDASGGATKLQPGTHTYPFAYQLPQGDFPSSFNGVHGQITYTMTVGINRPWRMTKDFVTELNFVHRVDANQPELWSPLSGSNGVTLCSLWRSSRRVTITASAEKKAFTPGETAKIACSVANASPRTSTLRVRLRQKQVYSTADQSNVRAVDKRLVSVTGRPLPSQTGEPTEITLTIPPSAALSISNCSLLHVEYMIEVTLKRWAAPDLTVLIPILLCDAPVNTHAHIVSV